MHPRYKTKYRVGNWPAYDRALVQRGDVTLWLTPEAIATWEAVGVGKRGGQLQYSEVAIETALTLRLIFHLPLRQTEGFLRSIFGMLCLDLSAPDHTTLSRRGQHLDLALRRLPAGAGIHLIVDSTGLSTVGEGEWAAVKHGGRGRRGWKKLHLGVDGSGVIVAHALGFSSRAAPRSPARDRTITLVKQLGRRRWKQASGYHRQGRAENAFFRYTSIIGDGLRARSPSGQGSEAVLACHVLNRMRDLGRPASYAIRR